MLRDQDAQVQATQGRSFLSVASTGQCCRSRRRLRREDMAMCGRAGSVSPPPRSPTLHATASLTKECSEILMDQTAELTSSDTRPQDEAHLQDKVCSGNEEQSTREDAAGGDTDTCGDLCKVEPEVLRGQLVRSELRTCLERNGNLPDIQVEKHAVPRLPPLFYNYVKLQPGREPNNGIPKSGSHSTLQLRTEYPQAKRQRPAMDATCVETAAPQREEKLSQHRGLRVTAGAHDLPFMQGGGTDHFIATDAHGLRWALAAKLDDEDERRYN